MMRLFAALTMRAARGDLTENVDGLLLMGGAPNCSLPPQVQVHSDIQEPVLLPMALYGNLQKNFQSLSWRVFLYVLTWNKQHSGPPVSIIIVILTSVTYRFVEQYSCVQLYLI